MLKDAQRLGLVLLGEVHADESACIPSGSRQVPGERIEGVQPELSPLLKFNDRPVFVPIRQAVSREYLDRLRAQVGHRGLRDWVQKVVGEGARFAEVYEDVGGNGEIGVRDDHCVVGDCSEAGDRRAQAGEGVCLRRVGPKSPGDRRARHQSVPQGEQREQMLGLRRQGGGRLFRRPEFKSAKY